MQNILILHCYHGEYPPRVTTWDWLYSFRRYSGCRCFYVNLYYSRIPWYLHQIKWDLIIFTDLFVLERWAPLSYRKIINKAQSLKKIKARKILIPQDEFIYSNDLCDLINDFNIEFVFTCAEEFDWKKIYNTVDFTKVQFNTVLTGYLDDTTIERINQLEKTGNDRIFDIGYRSKKVSPSLGRHGLLKSIVADVIQKRADEIGLNVNISLEPQDTFLGDAWYQFLLKCKYFIGVEGGASILDRNGSFKKNTDAYLKLHPLATLEEIESTCFPNQDGYLHLYAISPRHLEACATKTCQILIEGNYSGILQAGKHYIELKKDFSNLDDVLAIVKNDTGRQQITETTYHDIVESGLYTYKKFVELVLNHSLSNRHVENEKDCSWGNTIAYIYSRIFESGCWFFLAINNIFIKVLLSILPRTGVYWIKTILRC